MTKLADLQEGHIVVCNGLTCVPDGDTRTVQRDHNEPSNDQLFIRCDDGRHYLGGQQEAGEMVGITRIVSVALLDYEHAAIASALSFFDLTEDIEENLKIPVEPWRVLCGKFGVGEL